MDWVCHVSQQSGCMTAGLAGTNESVSLGIRVLGASSGVLPTVRLKGATTGCSRQCGLSSGQSCLDAVPGCISADNVATPGKTLHGHARLWGNEADEQNA